MECNDGFLSEEELNYHSIRREALLHCLTCNAISIGRKLKQDEARRGRLVSLGRDIGAFLSDNFEGYSKIHGVSPLISTYEGIALALRIRKELSEGSVGYTRLRESRINSLYRISKILRGTRKPKFEKYAHLLRDFFQEWALSADEMIALSKENSYEVI